MEPIRDQSGLPVADPAGSDDAPMVVDVGVMQVQRGADRREASSARSDLGRQATRASGQCLLTDLTMLRGMPRWSGVVDLTDGGCGRA